MELGSFIFLLGTLIAGIVLGYILGSGKKAGLLFLVLLCLLLFFLLSSHPTNFLGALAFILITWIFGILLLIFGLGLIIGVIIKRFV